jgi:hypothetical protein
MKKDKKKKIYSLLNKLLNKITKQFYKKESRKDTWNRLTEELGKSDFIK